MCVCVWRNNASASIHPARRPSASDGTSTCTCWGVRRERGGVACGVRHNHNVRRHNRGARLRVAVGERRNCCACATLLALRGCWWNRGNRGTCQNKVWAGLG